MTGGCHLAQVMRFCYAIRYMPRTDTAFALLHQAVEERGLLRESAVFYMCTAIVLTLLLAGSMALLAATDNAYVQIANAAFLAFVFGQFGFFFHDVGHGQVTGSRWHSLMSAWFSIMLGWSLDWWIPKHARHHAHPNEPGYDPDVSIAPLAFSMAQARKKKGFYRWVVRHQAYLFVVMLMGEVWHLRLASITFLLKRRTWRARGDLLLIGMHAALLGVLVFALLPTGLAGLFLVVHWALLSVYLGSAFAPNHKGMPMIEPDMPRDYVRQQVCTARNVRGGILTGILYGGLNYQIEHHLFPSMPRNRLRHTAPIVQAFCAARGIPYRTTGIIASYREIFAHLNAVGKSLPRT